MMLVLSVAPAALVAYMMICRLNERKRSIWDFEGFFVYFGRVDLDVLQGMFGRDVADDGQAIIGCRYFLVFRSTHLARSEMEVLA